MSERLVCDNRQCPNGTVSISDDGVGTPVGFVSQDADTEFYWMTVRWSNADEWDACCPECAHALIDQLVADDREAQNEEADVDV